jgi:hypothetical protein
MPVFSGILHGIAPARTVPTFLSQGLAMPVFCDILCQRQWLGLKKGLYFSIAEKRSIVKQNNKIKIMLAIQCEYDSMKIGH